VSSDLLLVPFSFHITSRSDDPLGQTRANVEQVIKDSQLPLSPDAVFDAQLCTTELVTNAFNHAGGEAWVTITWDGEFLRVDVEDRSMRLPRLKDADKMAESGRGLGLMEALVHSWGWSPKGLGKAVYFLMRPDRTASCSRAGSVAHAPVASARSTADAIASETPTGPIPALVLA
jgi:anti-sigma regulatory factor (Ser/Thr protein kinase)